MCIPAEEECRPQSSLMAPAPETPNQTTIREAASAIFMKNLENANFLHHQRVVNKIYSSMLASLLIIVLIITSMITWIKYFYQLKPRMIANTILVFLCCSFRLCVFTITCIICCKTESRGVPWALKFCITLTGMVCLVFGIYKLTSEEMSKQQEDRHNFYIRTLITSGMGCFAMLSYIIYSLRTFYDNVRWMYLAR